MLYQALFGGYPTGKVPLQSWQHFKVILWETEAIVAAYAHPVSCVIDWSSLDQSHFVGCLKEELKLKSAV